MDRDDDADDVVRAATGEAPDDSSRRQPAGATARRADGRVRRNLTVTLW